MIRLKRQYITFSILLIILSFAVLPANAQESINTITVEPASLFIDMSSQNSSNVSMLTIRNDYNTPVNMTAEFKGIDEAAGKIIPLGEPRQSISETLKLSATSFVVPANETYFLSVAATDGPSLSAGGHYATLLLTNTTGGVRSNSVQSRLSVGVFVVKRDGLITKVELTKRLFKRSGLALPKMVAVEILNDGNAHLTPRASVQILDKNNNVVSEGIFNQESRIALPGKRIAQDVTLTNLKRVYIPQKMKLQIRYRADEIAEAKVYQQEFWYVPQSNFYLLGLIVLMGVIYFINYKKTRSKAKPNKSISKI